MPIEVGNYLFNGPFTSTSDLEDRSGVYAIFDHIGEDYHVIDIGESSGVRTRIENHDRKPCWSRNAQGTLAVGVHYTPDAKQAGRTEIEQELREQFNPTCGDR